jgi:cytochrome c-type biogenesis protein CcmF
MAASIIRLVESLKVGETLNAGMIGSDLREGVWGLACFGLCAFTFTTIAQEFYRGIKMARANREVGLLDAVLRLFLRARRRYGGYVIHLGVVLMFFGWAGNSYGLERRVTLRPGDSTELRGYEIRHAGLVASEDWQKERITARIEVVRDGEVLEVLEPARWWFFQLPDQPTTEVARMMTVSEDVYVSIQTVDLTRGWTQMRLFLNPLVNWIWVGTAVMLFGGLICIGTRRKEREESHG